jgi:hypothetical protein
MNGYQGDILFQAQQERELPRHSLRRGAALPWLLFARDIMDSEKIILTQEFLSHMLGVRRFSVSLCAHALQ